MKLPVLSLDRAILSSIVDLARDIPPERRTSSSTAIELALSELVRETMRSIAQDRSNFKKGSRLLDVAIQTVAHRVTEELHRQEIHLALHDYLDRIEHKLHQAGNELEELSVKLSDSRGRGKIVPTQDLREGQSRRSELHRLGLLGFVYGLLVQPSGDVTEIDLGKLEHELHCQIIGEWFPFEIRAGEFLLILDDDGSLFLSVENFPDRLVDEAAELIQRVAQTLFADD